MTRVLAQTDPTQCSDFYTSLLYYSREIESGRILNSSAWPVIPALTNADWWSCFRIIIENSHLRVCPLGIPRWWWSPAHPSSFLLVCRNPTRDGRPGNWRLRCLWMARRHRNGRKSNQDLVVPGLMAGGWPCAGTIYALDSGISTFLLVWYLLSISVWDFTRYLDLISDKSSQKAIIKSSRKAIIKFSQKAVIKSNQKAIIEI